MTEKEEIKLSDQAAKRILAIIAEKSSGEKMLRLAVAGGGCSGFQYEFSLDKQKNNDDIIVENAGAVMVVDTTSMNFLAGAEVDFVQEPIGAYFKVNNPNAVSGCGCGSSFSVG